MLTVNGIFTDTARHWPPERIEEIAGRPGSLLWRWDTEYDAYKLGLALDVRGRFDGLPKFIYVRMDARPLNALVGLGDRRGVERRIEAKIDELVKAAAGQTRFELDRDVLGDAPQLESGA
ncbi:MAG TPA: hypothetical protein VIS51_03965 [Solirubrobacterales bacterium]